MESQAQERVNLFVPLVIILFLGSIIIIFNYMTADNETEVDLRENVIQNIPTLSAREIESKISECSSGRTTHQQDWCFLNLAKDNRIDSCDKIINQDFRKYCEAMIQQDVSKCDEIFAASAQDACYITLATITRDVRICRKSQREEFCRSLFN